MVFPNFVEMSSSDIFEYLKNNSLTPDEFREIITQLCAARDGHRKKAQALEQFIEEQKNSNEQIVISYQERIGFLTELTEKLAKLAAPPQPININLNVNENISYLCFFPDEIPQDVQESFFQLFKEMGKALIPINCHNREIFSLGEFNFYLERKTYSLTEKGVVVRLFFALV
jgi:hypothetical protein